LAAAARVFGVVARSTVAADTARASETRARALANIVSD
jgi:hypothetical protein